MVGMDVCCQSLITRPNESTPPSSHIKGNSVGSHQSATDSDMIISLIVCSYRLVSLLIRHAPIGTSLSSYVYLYTPNPLPSMLFSWGFAHHHGTLSRSDSIIDILCTNTLVPLIQSRHRPRRGPPGSPPGELLLLQGGVWRSGDGTATGAGRHPQCCFTPGSLGWLGMKETQKGSSAGDSEWIDVVNRINGSCGEIRWRLESNTYHSVAV